MQVDCLMMGVGLGSAEISWTELAVVDLEVGVEVEVVLGG